MTISGEEKNIADVLVDVLFNTAKLEMNGPDDAGEM